MSSLHSIHEGTIAAKPFEHQSGRVSGAPEQQHGKVHAHAHHRHHGQVGGDPETSAQNAVVAEITTLVASLSSLSSQAQSLPLSPPSLPQMPSPTYRPQVTDYTQAGGDAL